MGQTYRNSQTYLERLYAVDAPASLRKHRVVSLQPVRELLPNLVFVMMHVLEEMSRSSVSVVVLGSRTGTNGSF